MEAVASVTDLHIGGGVTVRECPECCGPKDTPITHTFCSRCERLKVRDSDAGWPHCNCPVKPRAGECWCAPFGTDRMG